MIDTTKNYRIEPKVLTTDSSNLGREGLSRHVGTIRTFSLAYNDITKKYKTGLDEHAPEVKMLSGDAHKEKVEWIRKTKKSLEDQSGINLDANNDDFWRLYKIQVEVGDDKKIKVMGGHPQFQPNLYWEHLLALIVLDANDILPRSRKESGNPKYRDCQFILTTTEEEDNIHKESNKKNRRRNVEMSKLFEGETADYNRAFNIAYLMGVVKEEVGVDKLESVLEAFTPQKEYLDKFLELCSLENDEIALRTTIKKAVDYDIIQYNGELRVYHRGVMNFAPTTEETVNMIKVGMAEPAIAREFAEIKAAVVKRDSKKKKK